jgi:hypothetical protein
MKAMAAAKTHVLSVLRQRTLREAPAIFTQPVQTLLKL